jgi:hypothetical protein
MAVETKAWELYGIEAGYGGDSMMVVDPKFLQ